MNLRLSIQNNQHTYLRQDHLKSVRYWVLLNIGVGVQSQQKNLGLSAGVGAETVVLNSGSEGWRQDPVESITNPV